MCTVYSVSESHRGDASPSCILDIASPRSPGQAPPSAAYNDIRWRFDPFRRLTPCFVPWSGDDDRIDLHEARDVMVSRGNVSIFLRVPLSVVDYLKENKYHMGKWE